MFIAVQLNRLWNTTMFFVLGWAIHYLPHYLMNRQLVRAFNSVVLFQN